MIEAINVFDTYEATFDLHKSKTEIEAARLV